MAKKIGERMRELRRIVRLHTNWFTVALLGKDAVTDAEFRELEEYDKLPMGETLDLAKKSYLLGRLQATSKSSDYKKLSYEEVDSKAKKAAFTSLEEYAIEHAKLHAADGLKGLSESIEAGAFSRLKDAVQETVGEASVRGIIQDRTAMALTEKQPYQKLASTLAAELKAESGRDWKRVAATEMHRAKQVGAAQAIVNRIGPYKNSEGPDSMVRIIPNPDTCPDCDSHYMKDGKHKTFRLSEILQAGSNADAGVKHTRKDGKHGYWKTTLPPLHPGCGCRIAYAPETPLAKAVDKGSTSPIVKPPGPPQPATTPTPGSIPGVAAPGNEPGPGAPAGGDMAAAQTHADPESGMGVDQKQMVDCPFNGGDECVKNGGFSPGAKRHEANGVIMERHREAQEAGAEATNPEAAAADNAAQLAQATAYSKHPPEDQRVIADLTNNQVVERIDGRDAISAEERSSGAAGVMEASKVRLKDNGYAWEKPDVKFSSQTGGLAEMSFAASPVGRLPHHEAAAYSYSSYMGSNSTPVAVTRNNAKGDFVSMAAHIDGAKNMGVHMRSTAPEEASKNGYNAVLNNTAEGSRDTIKQKLDTMISMQLASNGADDHWDNIMGSVNDDGKITDIHNIDNGLSFSNSMHGTNNAALRSAAHASSDGMFHMPDSVTDKFKSNSFGDLKKALGDNLLDWQVGQQFMREKYMAHLQEMDGGIDPERFLQTQVNGADGSVGMPGANDFGDSHGLYKQWGKNNAEASEQFEKREAAEQLPHQLFESFCMAWLNEASNDENSSHSQDAKDILELGIFMPPAYRREAGDKAADTARSTRGNTHYNSMHSPNYVRSQGYHQDYQSKIKAAYPAKREELVGRGVSSKAEIYAGTAAGKKKLAKGLGLYLDLTKAWE